MTGPGRPKTSDVELRRRRLLLVLVRSTASSSAAVKRVAELTAAGERTVEKDLDALAVELEACSGDELPKELTQAIEVALSYKQLQALAGRIMTFVSDGTISEERAKALLDGITVQRHLVRAERDDQPREAVRALEILTPDEETLLEEYRRKLAGPPVPPGASVPPPGGGS